jgi:large subunit ribosomal protein L31
MKKDIHPKYYKEAKIKCSCGHEFTIGAVKKEMKVEICSQCHPFYTGRQRVIDKEGRIEKFKRKYEKYKK